LLESVVDKHDFYADPLEFDRQLAVLERYLEDHVRDDDARLVLATNYLFGNRPAAAVDLLEEPFAAGLKSDTAALMVLSTARSVQYSLLQMRSEADAAAADPTPVGAGETLESGETDD
jgi:hypothetical protein